MARRKSFSNGIPFPVTPLPEEDDSPERLRHVAKSVKDNLAGRMNLPDFGELVDKGASLNAGGEIIGAASSHSRSASRHSIREALCPYGSHVLDRMLSTAHPHRRAPRLGLTPSSLSGTPIPSRPMPDLGMAFMRSTASGAPGRVPSGFAPSHRPVIAFVLNLAPRRLRTIIDFRTW